MAASSAWSFVPFGLHSPRATAELPAALASRSKVSPNILPSFQGGVTASVGRDIVTLRVAVASLGALVAVAWRKRSQRHSRQQRRTVKICANDSQHQDRDEMAAEGIDANSPSVSRCTGILLMNIGTPASTSEQDVRSYLSKFLADNRVIELKPAALKWLVLKFLLRSRPAAAAENYKKIWDAERGSPLLFHSLDLAERLQQKLGGSFNVKVGMQYSDPTVQQSMKEFRDAGIDGILLVPMFPQYASSTTGSCLELAYKTASAYYSTPFISVLPPFFNHPAYLAAMKQTISSVIGPRGKGVDFVLFSFHGVPEAQCVKAAESGSFCGKIRGCCDQLVKENRNCYRAQCFETALLLARELELEEGSWDVSFQSRLTLRNTVQWIKPYTDEFLDDLPKKGKRRVAVVAPAFTADCVETLEELSISGREEFEAAGGEELLVVPCLNSSEPWVEKLAEIVRESVSVEARKSSSGL